VVVSFFWQWSGKCLAWSDQLFAWSAWLPIGMVGQQRTGVWNGRLFLGLVGSVGMVSNNQVNQQQPDRHSGVIQNFSALFCVDGYRKGE